MIYTRDTPLERFFDQVAVHRRKRSAAFDQLPMWPHDLLWRALQGVPLVESYTFNGTTYSIPAGTRPRGVPEPDAIIPRSIRGDGPVAPPGTPPPGSDD